MIARRKCSQGIGGSTREISRCVLGIRRLFRGSGGSCSSYRWARAEPRRITPRHLRSAALTMNTRVLHPSRPPRATSSVLPPCSNSRMCPLPPASRSLEPHAPASATSTTHPVAASALARSASPSSPGTTSSSPDRAVNPPWRLSTWFSMAPLE